MKRKILAKLLLIKHEMFEPFFIDGILLVTEISTSHLMTQDF